MFRSRQFLATSVLLGLMIPLLVLAGLLVHNVIASSLATNHTIRQARTDVALALQLQLDEETGIRGFTATHQTLYLAPFDTARTRLGATLDDVRAAIEAIDSPEHAASALSIDGARDLNATWLAKIALPLRAHPDARDADARQREGKRLVDAFRARLGEVDASLNDLQTANDARIAVNVDRIAIVVGLGSLIIIIAAVLNYSMQQRYEVRLERERHILEEERRNAAAFQAAYETEKRIADTLQEGFSQRPLPTLPMVRFSASYIPATEETRVGGDWYDAVELSASRVLFTIGDVAGHGLDAAVTMNRARQAVLGSALLNADPAQILERINAEFVRQGAPMVTAIVGIADSKTYEFIFATSGHPPPVLVEPGRPARMLEVGGLPLGVVENAAYRTVRVQSVPGAMLVLYTDGAVEHSHDVLEGERLLLEAASTIHVADEREAATAIHRAIFSGRAVGDDVAILTVGFSSVDAAGGLFVSAEHAQATVSGRFSRTPLEERTAGGALRSLRRRAEAAAVRLRVAS
jgi:serine phosphatase RsbU (regulator of sigma subunit)/CHASE3 domain sensor protein